MGFCKEICKKLWKKYNTWNIRRLVDQWDGFYEEDKVILRSTPLIKMSRNVSHKLYQLLRVPELKDVNIKYITSCNRNDDFLKSSK